MADLRPTVETLVDQLLKVFPALDEIDQKLSLALYRRLAKGLPVALSAIAAEVEVPITQVEPRVERWPGVYYDDERRVVGYWGLSLKPMSHQLRVDGRKLFARCAWDTLFLPELLGQTAEVLSVCRASGEAVRLCVSHRAVERAEPREMVVSFLFPDESAVRHDVISNFCHYVHFFVSSKDAQPWLAQNSGAFVLSLDEAFEVGQRRNRALYSAVPGR